METLTLGLLLTLSPIQQEIANHIRSNNPALDTGYINKVAKVISYEAGDISPFLISAIYMQESGYDYKACRKLKKVCVDHGIGQVYWRTAKAMKMSIYALTSDLTYSVQQSVKILRYFHKRYSRKEKNWFVRYNCGTKKSIDRKTCNEYNRKVRRWL